MSDMVATGIVNYILFGIVLGIGNIAFKNDTESFPIHLDNKGLKLFGEGMLLGFILFLIYPLVLIVLGIGKIEINQNKMLGTIPIILVNVFGYLAVSLFEETFFRGFIFLNLRRKYSNKIAIIVSAIFFGALHFLSYFDTANFWVGIINASIIGVLLCLIVIYTNSLMLPIGYHLSWNLTQSLLLDRYDIFITLGFEENIFTGSKSTPEAGLVVGIILLVMYIYMEKRIKPTKD